jgi:membrane-associated protease RseP (regulator of RpoE activity)
MNNLEEVEPEDEARTYRQANFPARFLTVVAGVTMNALIAVVLIWVLLAVVGVTGGKVLPGPPEFRGDIQEVLEDSPAARAGLTAGDRIQSIDGVTITDFDQLRSTVGPRMGETVPVVLVRDGETSVVRVTPGRYVLPDGATGCGLGITAGTVPRPTERVNPIVAVPKSFVELGRFTGLTIQGLGRFFSPSGLADYGDQVVNASGEQEASPACTPTPATRPAGGGSGGGSGSEAPNRLLSLVGLFQIGTDAPNVELLLFLFATLNITLAVINLIPLLPFDGGHIAVAVYERIQERRKRMQGRYFADVAKLLPLTYAVVLILFLLMISSIYLDIASPITE